MPVDYRLPGCAPEVSSPRTWNDKSSSSTNSPSLLFSDAGYDARARGYAATLAWLAPKLRSVTFLEATYIDEQIMDYFRAEAGTTLSGTD